MLNREAEQPPLEPRESHREVDDRYERCHLEMSWTRPRFGYLSPITGSRFSGTFWHGNMNWLIKVIRLGLTLTLTLWRACSFVIVPAYNIRFINNRLAKPGKYRRTAIREWGLKVLCSNSVNVISKIVLLRYLSDFRFQLLTAITRDVS